MDDGVGASRNGDAAVVSRDAGPAPDAGPTLEAGVSADAGPAPLTLFTIVLENQDYADIVNDAVSAPYIASLIDSYGLATNYHDSGVHPSLPNYLTMITGKQYPGTGSVNPTVAPFPLSAANLGTQLQAAGIPWRSYQDSMGSPCKLTATPSASGEYVPRHDPFLYFDDMQNGADDLCARTNVDYSQFPADLASGAYRYMWITPNKTHDGHDPGAKPKLGLKNADAWLAAELPKILASAAYQANGVVFLTWDEAEGRGANSSSQIPMLVISKKVVAGTRIDTKLSHKSYLASVEDLLGLPRLATVTNEPTLLAFLQP